MLTRKFLRTLGKYKAQFISMVIMVTLGIGMFVGFNMEWVSIEHNMTSFFETSGFADYRLVDESGFSEDVLTDIKRLNGIENAARVISVNTDVKDTDGDSINLNVTTDPDVSGFVLINGEKYDPFEKNGIWLSDQYAAKNNLTLGDEITLRYKNYQFTGKIKGFVKAA